MRKRLQDALDNLHTVTMEAFQELEDLYSELDQKKEKASKKRVHHDSEDDGDAKEEGAHDGDDEKEDERGVTQVNDDWEKGPKDDDETYAEEVRILCS